MPVPGEGVGGRLAVVAVYHVAQQVCLVAGLVGAHAAREQWFHAALEPLVSVKRLLTLVTPTALFTLKLLF